MIYLLIIFCAWERQIQTDWMGGAGIPGPVTNWNTRYYEGDSITAAIEGQTSLIATNWDYTSAGWARHSIELNSGIPSHAQGLMPADVDNDGIKDLVAHTKDSVVWYKNAGNYVFTKQIIGFASSGGVGTPCVFPSDLDKDGDVDVLAGIASGVAWFENQNNGSVWICHQIANAPYHRVSSADVDLDGDLDIIAVQNTWYGNIDIFENDGFQNFTLTQALSGRASTDGWRVYPVDFNKDGYPDLYSVLYNVCIYLNDGASNPGHFTESFYATLYSDGGWPSDINMDGNMDLVCGEYGVDRNFYAFLGDGTGTNFTRQALTSGGFPNYTDGAMAIDLDLDGLPDILGTQYEVGWFRQSGALTFTSYNIDNLTGGSHWIYAAPLNNKCSPGMDILVTRSGEHIVYENKMIKSFASSGGFTSSILELSDTLKQLKYFGWKACVPKDSTLAFWCRADSIANGINSQGWSGPYYATQNIDSIAVSPAFCVRYFQYKVEFASQDTPLDIPVLYEVWVAYDTCSGGYVEETKTNRKLSLKIIGNKIMLSPGKRIDKAELCIYNITGEFVQTLYKGELENKTYTFIPELKRKGVYLVACKCDGNTKTVKFVKMK